MSYCTLTGQAFARRVKWL